MQLGSLCQSGDPCAGFKCEGACEGIGAGGGVQCHLVEVGNGELGMEALGESTDNGVPVIGDVCRRCVVEDCESMVDASKA